MAQPRRRRQRTVVSSITENHMLGMPSHATEHQRALMRSFYRSYNGDEAAVCAAYAKAETEGLTFRKRGSLRLSPEEYAKMLLADGLRKGWISSTMP